MPHGVDHLHLWPSYAGGSFYVIAAAWMLAVQLHYVGSMMAKVRKSIDGASLRSLLQRCFMWRGVWAFEDADPFMVQKIEEMAQKQLLARVRTNMEISFFTLFPLSLPVFVHAATHYFEADSNDYFYDDAKSQYGCIALVDMIVCLWYARPVFITKCTLRLAYTCLMIRVVSYEFFPPDEEGDIHGPFSPYFAVVMTAALRVWFGFISQDSNFIIAVHILTSTVCVLGHTNLQDSIAELLFATLVCVATLIFEKSTRANIRASLESQMSKELGTVQEMLLAGMCDAVVHLDDSYHISAPCPKLASLLLQLPTTPYGSNFSDFIAEESDKEAFVTFIQRPCGFSAAETLHTTLLDCNKTQVHVQLFHAKCTTIEGRVEHVLAVQDVGEERRPGFWEAREGDTHSPLRGDVVDQLGVYKHRSDRSLSSVSSLKLASDAQALRVNVWLDLRDTAFAVLKCSQTFVDMVGPLLLASCNGFSQLVVRRCREDFVTELCHASNKLLYEDSGATVPISFCLRTQLHGEIRVVAQADIDLDYEDGDDAEVVRLRFTTWKRERKHVPRLPKPREQQPPREPPATATGFPSPRSPSRSRSPTRDARPAPPSSAPFNGLLPSDGAVYEGKGEHIDKLVERLSL
mmetsp:Transcript_69380/g.166352  ORF Transcript_69380/g.166352 Transcript_69380/m.166352 type:complete len:632 (-) Transcript_69380:183-2078(-)